MGTRLNYALPIGRQLVINAVRRLRPGSLAATLPDSRPDRPFVIVAGAGRSGTSAVGRVLHESGVSMGERLREASDVNPDGFYEDLDVVQLNHRIMRDLGMTRFQRAERWPWRSTVLAIARRYGGAMREEVARAQGGWKDPRFAVTLEAWLPYLPRQLKVVVCLRSPTAYADSVIRIIGLTDRQTMERLWARMYRRLLDVMRDYRIPAHCVEYDSLIEDPAGTIAALSEFIGQPLDPRFVEERRRHFTHWVTPEYVPLYQEVLALGQARSVALGATVAGGRGRRSTRSAPLAATGAAARDRLSARSAPSPSPEAVDAYTDAIDRIDRKVLTARAAWTVETGLPNPKIVDYEDLGLTMAEAIETTRAASAAYSAVLLDAQEELGALDAPAGFERYHQATKRLVDNERLAGEVMLVAVRTEMINPEVLKTFLRIWRDHVRPTAVERARRARAKEYRRALKASGYRSRARRGGDERHRRVRTRRE